MIASAAVVGAGGNGKWDQEGHRGTEDEGQQHQRGHDSDDLAPAQVGGQDRLDVVLERRGSGDVGAGEARGSQGVAQGARIGRSPLQVECRADVAVEDPGHFPQCHDVGGRHRRERQRQNRLSMARRVAADGFDTWKTTVKVPSTFSPKCWVKMASACPESLPGTASEVERSPGKRTAEKVPTMITAIQSAITTDAPANGHVGPSLEHGCYISTTCECLLAIGTGADARLASRGSKEATSASWGRDANASRSRAG